MNSDTITDFRPQALVVCAGTFPTAAVPVHLLDSCQRTVCCDGAAAAYLASGRTPWRIVGDCDSLPPEIMQRYATIVRRNPDQDTNDQTKAVQYLAAHGLRRIAIVGATGLREDHTLGNISLLMDYMRHGIEVRTYTDHGLFLPCRDHAECRCAPGTQVSVFNFGARGLHADGLRWPLRDFDSWWQGTLNTAPTGRFTVDADGPFLLFINYPQSN